MRLWFLVSALVAALIASSAFAADPVQTEISSLDEQQGRLAIGVNATGPDGKPITGLGVANFKVSINDTAVNISDVQTQSVNRLPANVVLLVDVSGSMAGDPISQARIAIQEFVRGLDPGDRVAVISFGSKVTLLQDFTDNRTLLNQAIAKLLAVGETALYDAVIEGAKKISEAPPGRRTVVVLSDGEATTSLNLRGDSVEAARASGVNFVNIGLGRLIDRTYLTELATASGGRYLEAPTAASLRQAYTDLATRIRSQYTLIVTVPRGVDRTLPAKLTVQVTSRTDTGKAERTLNPLPGAVPPPFDLSFTGLVPGQKLKAPVTLQPVAPAGVTVATVEYWLDGTLIHTAAAAPFAYEFDPATATPANHILKVVVLDPRGRRGETQVPFIVIAPKQPRSLNLPWRLLALPLLVIAFGAAAFTLFQKRQKRLGNYVGRLKPFAVRMAEPAKGVEGWPEPPEPVAAPPPPEDRILGRVVVMNEQALRAGQLESIREFEFRSNPLTLGTAASSDIFIDDPEGKIAAEEARLWVQKGRMVYHKLTTLSAMATEGVTSGWQLLEDGDELRVGPYRILFQLQGQADASTEPEPLPELPSQPPQEHGMALRDLWTRLPDEGSPMRPSAE